MATIDDTPAELLAGQAARLRDDARQADELLTPRKIDEARELVAQNVHYARAIWHHNACARSTASAGRAREIATALDSSL